MIKQIPCACAAPRGVLEVRGEVYMKRTTSTRSTTQRALIAGGAKNEKDLRQTAQRGARARCASSTRTRPASAR